MRILPCETLTVCLLALLSLSGCAAAGADEIVFQDVKRQSEQFIRWYETIELTPQQESTMKTALEPLPAPCCSDYSAYTCCCECNVSRSIWGLSRYLIAKQGADANKVRSKVEEWIAFVNPRGYSGTTCSSGGCARPFAHDGCGGMKADQVVF